MQRMDLVARVDRADRRDQRLPGYMTTESACRKPESGLKTLPR